MNPEPDPLRAARLARQNAEAQRNSVDRRWPILRAMGDRMRELRTDNGFSEKWAALIRGEETPE